MEKVGLYFKENNIMCPGLVIIKSANDIAKNFWALILYGKTSWTGGA